MQSHRQIFSIVMQSLKAVALVEVIDHNPDQGCGVLGERFEK